MKTLARMLVVALGLSSVCLTGCNLTPGWVEGIVESETFHIADTHPAYRVARDSGEFNLAISEEDGVQLRVVTLKVPDISVLPLEMPIAVGDRDSGAPWMTVSYGDLVIIDRGDGVRIISSENPRFADIEDGNITFTSTDPDHVEGYFHLDLVDDGYLDGQFETVSQSE